MLYQPPRPSWRRVCEPQPDPLSEAELSLIWEAQRYPPGALSLSAGGELEVLNPGRRGGGAGPDFRGAVVRIGGEERLGDVELHLRASYFFGHGHHLDPAYDGLVLHAVFLDDVGGHSPLACGGRVAVAAFAPWVAARSADIAAWLERPPLWTEPCHDAVARLGEDGVAMAVLAAGEARFRARTQALDASIAAEGGEEALWQALMEALGYGGDREGFRRLGRTLPAALLRRVAGRQAAAGEGAVQAALLAVAGLDPAPELAQMLPPPLAPPLRDIGSRPANRARARLLAAGSLFQRAPGGLGAYAMRSVSEAGGPSELRARWTLPRPADRGSSVLGASRATELLLNAVLPFVAAQRPELAGRCLQLAAALPATAPYGKTVFLERNLARPGGRRRVSSALEQQGLLGLHAAWCSRGGCGRCPLS